MATKVKEKDEAAIKPRREKPRPAAPAQSAAARNSAFGRMSRYLREVQVELKKTTWPTKEELIASTQVVLGLLVVVGLYMFLVDVTIGFLFTKAGLGFKG